MNKLTLIILETHHSCNFLHCLSMYIYFFLEHIIAGLSPRGVPKDLIGTTIPFKYNNFEQIENIVKNNEIAAIKMEVERNEPPQNNFLEKIRNLATKNGVVLIFDECTSGFRETFGGLHKKYDVQPDIAMFC